MDKQDNRDNRANPPADDEKVDWDRRTLILGSGIALFVGAAALFESSNIAKAASAIVGSPVDSGLTTVYQQDYYFIPNQMTWRVGTPMILHIHNLSDVHFHEMQIGRGGFQTDPNVFSDLKVQFNVDFWDGVPVTILEANRVDNFVTNKALIKSDVPTGPWLLTGAGNGNFSPTLYPGGDIKLQFNVPNKPGIWQYGCFVQGFIHWKDGMKGTINILNA